LRADDFGFITFSIRPIPRVWVVVKFGVLGGFMCMNYRAFIIMMAGFAAFFLCGCASYTRVSRGTLPPILVPAPQTVTSGDLVITLPAGTYTAHFRDGDGIYYRASGAMVLSAPDTGNMWGGLFIPNPEAKEQRQAVWLYGAFSELTHLSTKMRIFQLNERVEYGTRADQFLRQ